MQFYVWRKNDITGHGAVADQKTLQNVKTSQNRYCPPFREYSETIFSCFREVRYILLFCRQIDGCTNIVLAREELNVAQISRLWRTRFYVNAQVTETLTGVTMKSKAENRNFKQRSVLMSFSGTSDKFKPGLPFKYVVGNVKDL